MNESFVKEILKFQNESKVKELGEIKSRENPLEYSLATIKTQSLESLKIENKYAVENKETKPKEIPPEGKWDVLAKILEGEKYSILHIFGKKEYSISVDRKAKTIIITDNKGNTVFLDRAKYGDVWDNLAKILEREKYSILHIFGKKEYSISADPKGKTIIITDNDGKTVFLDRTKDGDIKMSSVPFETQSQKSENR